MVALLQSIIELLVGGISGIASGIGEGLQELVTNIFVSGSGTAEAPYALTAFGGIIIVFMGVSLAIGLCRWIMNFLTSMGNN